jgi:hypothetical protein
MWWEMSIEVAIAGFRSARSSRDRSPRCETHRGHVTFWRVRNRDRGSLLGLWLSATGGAINWDVLLPLTVLLGAGIGVAAALFDHHA